jgi:hypothetical protein
MDKISWGTIWDAVKREQAAETGLDINSEELKQIAGKRFDEVIRFTQVYDSTLTRSQTMRSKSVWAKMVTSFMAEPTVTYNMVYDALQNITKHPGKAAATFASVAFSIVVNTLLKSVVTAARDDDDEEATYEELYVKNVMSDLIGGFAPMTYVPLLSDIWSIAQGFTVERTDLEVFNLAKEFMDVLQNDNASNEKKLRTAVSFISMVSGVPLSNVWREVDAIKNTITAAQNAERPDWFDTAVERGLSDGVILSYFIDDSKAANVDKLYEEARAGSKDAAETREHLIMYNGVDDDKAVDALMRARIKEGFIAGEIDEDEALEMLTEHGGKRRNEAEDLISEWSYTRDNDGRKYDDMKDAFLAGEISAEEAIDARVKYGGAEEENSERTVQTWQYQRDTGYVYDDMRDDVLDGEISAADAIAYRVKYGGVKQETAEATVGRWEYERKYGYAYEDLREEHAAGNITSAEAMRAMTEYGGKEADDAYWEVAEWDYVNDGGEWDGKGTLLNDAFAGGDAAKVRSSMAQLLEHSDWKKPGNELASYVTNYYKPLFETATADRKRQLQPVILDYIQMAHEAAGEEYFGDDYTLRYRSWLKIK